MLNRIFIQNFALIDTLDISLNQGLQVITGETGAGKSIILGALRLILGERIDTKSLQNSEQKSIVEAEFSIGEQFQNYFEENDLDFDTTTIIRREILPSGKSRAFINDVPVTLDVLKELSAKLIDIHSQFETANLFNEDYQFRMIDGLGENKNLIADYQKDFYELRKLKSELQKKKNQFAEGNKEADYKLFILNELEEMKLDDLDYEEMQAQLAMQENAESISENLSIILSRLDQEEMGVLDQLGEVRSRLAKTAELSHHFSELAERFESQFIDFKDFVFEIQNESEKIEINPELLFSLNEKFNKINALFLKHNVGTVEELIEIRNQISSEQSGFEDLEQQIDELEQQIANQEKALEKTAKILSKNRITASSTFKEKIEKLLVQLGLEKAKIEIRLTALDEFTSFGKEAIAIYFQANTGFPLKPIQSAISGGERSRVMLAVKKVMAENADLPTLILDEIDTGVSGKVADEIGKVMQEMANDMQLIVITHLAQVAAKGNHNYKVVKSDINGKTQTTIIALKPEEKLQEIAQLLSGSKITDAALQQAEELMGS
ncbi:MAG: DNA repair protein RecN [Cruoricaptor ignavus]|nr:DNA repair protein RecN [Cruoricaptor ignavus]